MDPLSAFKQAAKVEKTTENPLAAINQSSNQSSFGQPQRLQTFLGASVKRVDDDDDPLRAAFGSPEPKQPVSQLQSTYQSSFQSKYQSNYQSDNPLAKQPTSEPSYQSDNPLASHSNYQTDNPLASHYQSHSESDDPLSNQSNYQSSYQPSNQFDSSDDQPSYQSAQAAYQSYNEPNDQSDNPLQSHYQSTTEPTHQPAPVASAVEKPSSFFSSPFNRTAKPSTTQTSAQSTTQSTTQPSTSTHFHFARKPETSHAESSTVAAASTAQSAAQSVTQPAFPSTSSSPTNSQITAQPAVYQPPELTEQQKLDIELHRLFGGPPPKHSNLTIDQSINEIITESINQTISQPVDQSNNQSDNQFDESGVVRLCSAGRWRDVVRLTSTLLNIDTTNMQDDTNDQSDSRSIIDQSTNQSIRPHEQLRLYCYLIAGLIKLKRFVEANVCFKRIGSFDRLVYDNYPVYRSMEQSSYQGSMVPFRLHLLYAQLPHWSQTINQSSDQSKNQSPITLSIDRLMQIKADVVNRSANLPTCSDEEWSQREQEVLFILVNLLTNQSVNQSTDYSTAIRLLSYHLLNQTSDQASKGLFGRLSLMFGDVLTAERFFAELESGNVSRSTMIAHRQMLALAKGDYRVLPDFALQSINQPANPSNDEANKPIPLMDPILTNNAAMAALFSNNLTEAIRILEKYMSTTIINLSNNLLNHQSIRLEPVIISNLKMFYDLASMPQRRRMLDYLVLTYGSDDLEIM